ncbi:MAG: DUF4920 domain-containing protein [Deltaproteobacteria bacterium]|nr:DUF4920 domain-containing protein [Deltaproteobacteria bacterium]
MKLRLTLLIALLSLVGWACQQPSAPADAPAGKEQPAKEAKQAKADDGAKPVDLDKEEAHEHGEDHGDVAKLAAKAAKASGPLDVKLGQPLKTTQVVAVLDLMKDPSAYEGKTVRIEGKVTDMCYHSRSWFGVASPDGKRVIRLIAAPRFQVPKGAIGAKAMVEGKVKVSTLDPKELDHYKKAHKFISEEELKSGGPIRQAVIIASGAEFKR